MKTLYLLLFMLVQQAMSVFGQLLLKIGMAQASPFTWTWHNVGRLFLNYNLQFGLWLLPTCSGCGCSINIPSRWSIRLLVSDLCSAWCRES